MSLSSKEAVAAVDVFMTPLCLIAAECAIDEIHQVCARLHYSTISTMLLGKVIKDAQETPEKEQPVKLASAKRSFVLRIEHVKLGLLQSSTNHEAVFNQPSVPRHMPCLTYLIVWLESTELKGTLDKEGLFSGGGHLRRLHAQLRANTIPSWEAQLEGANIVHLQESEHRPQRQVMVGFRTRPDWGYIMAEAGIEGAKLTLEHPTKAAANAELATERIWTLAAAPSSLSKQRQWSLLSTASSGVKSWIEQTEEVGARVARLTEMIVEQRCKVVTAPLAHHLAQEHCSTDDIFRQDVDGYH